jgi:hypothetical protein
MIKRVDEDRFHQNARRIEPQMKIIPGGRIRRRHHGHTDMNQLMNSHFCWYSLVQNILI